MNDTLDNLFAGDTGPVRTAPVRAAAVTYKTAEERFEEKCGKCGGTGRFVGYTGRVFGRCFACKGAGRFTFKTSPETRAANRAQAADRAERKQQQVWADFAAQQGPVADWIKAKAPTFDFAAKLYDAVIKYGDLTTGQREAVERLIARDAQRATERAERLQQAPQVDTAGIDRLKEAFDKAKAYAAAKATGLTIKNPKITIGGITISPAKATSANPGALYVKQGGEYLGKIAGGQFFASRDCTSSQKDQVLAFVADPAKAAKVYGQETGVCCLCGATLRSEWRLKGVGPICAEKYGFV